jgi:hypothetical protein
MHYNFVDPNCRTFSEALFDALKKQHRERLQKELEKIIPMFPF